MNRTGIIESSEQMKQPTTRFRRALFGSPVFLKIRSLTAPPTASPTTPPKKTPAENKAEFFRSCHSCEKRRTESMQDTAKESTHSKNTPTSPETCGVPKKAKALAPSPLLFDHHSWAGLQVLWG